MNTKQELNALERIKNLHRRGAYLRKIAFEVLIE
jgi:hypothetical protein